MLGRTNCPFTYCPAGRRAAASFERWPAVHLADGLAPVQIGIPGSCDGGSNEPRWCEMVSSDFTPFVASEMSSMRVWLTRGAPPPGSVRCGSDVGEVAPGHADFGGGGTRQVLR